MNIVNRIRFRDLAVTDKDLKHELLDVVDTVLSHGMLILGEEVVTMEREIANYCHRKYCIGVGSGTDALYLSLRALDIGVGDEVITTPLTWVATTNAIVLTGATPVFCDIRDDFNLNPDLLEGLITDKTKAILPVNFTGQMCDMDKILEIAEKYDIYLIEDAAQSFGSCYKDKPSGSFGDISCFSINPMKNLSAYGEAGVVLTDNYEIAKKIASLRYAGTVNKEDCHYPSINGRIDTLQAAMISVNLKYFHGKISRIREIAATYDKFLNQYVKIPKTYPDSLQSYYSYTILVDNREKFIEYMEKSNIETKVQHPYLMPYHSAYKGVYHASIPVADEIVKKLICIPCHEKLTDEEVKRVCDKIACFCC